MSEQPVFVELRPMEGREIPVTPGAIVGREGTDVVVADPEVSRRHAAIREHPGGAAIEDLGSTNGTFVNDRRIDGVEPLRDGDTVRFGNTVWRLRAGAPAGATMVVPAQPAAPELTAQHAVPAQPVAPPPPQPAAPRPAQVGARGDVPAPPDVVPSAVRRVLPPPAPGQAAAFSPPGQRRITSSRGSAATRVEATIVCLALVVAVAVALALYFGSQG